LPLTRTSPRAHGVGYVCADAAGTLVPTTAPDSSSAVPHMEIFLLT
jgi:hypothetical protein